MDIVNKLNVEKQQKYGPFVDGQLLFPTTIQDRHKNVLGLAYSTQNSLIEAIEKKEGIYWSRTRNELWKKSDSDINSQKLLEVKLNCDGTAILFTVEQRGVFCHEKCLSCFDSQINKEIKTVTTVDTLKLSYCIGNSEAITFDLLNKLGIYVYVNKQNRNYKNLIKTHLHQDIKLISTKPKDINSFLEDGLMDIAVCYDNLVNESNVLKKYNKLKPSTPVHPVELVILKKKHEELQFNKIFTEYFDLTDDYLTKRNIKYDCILEITGNAESYLLNDMCDACVTIKDSGKTIDVNDLEIVSTINTSDICIYINKNVSAKYPRLVRELKNNLHKDIIFFFSVDDKNGFLSNFYPSEFMENNIKYKSVEHYYQAHKFTENREIFDKILECNTSKEAYKISKLHSNLVDKDWEDRKDKTMYVAVYLKFTQNTELKNKLLDTKNKTLVEHAMTDYYWGCGSDGTGLNRLGETLMELRSNISKFT